jgi:phosphoglycolate phosphatase
VSRTGRSALMKYKLVIFDFDGTLADSFEWFLGVVD